MRDLQQLFNNKNYKKIISDFKEDQLITPNNWHKNYLISISYFHIGQYDNSLKKLLNIDNYIQKHEVKNYIAKCYQSLNMDNDAITFYEKAIELNKEIPGYFNELGNIYSKYLKTNLAIENYKKAIKLINSNKSKSILFLNIGLAFYRVGQIEDATINNKKSIDLDPNIPNSWLNLGLCYNKLKNYELAKNSFLEAIKLDQNFFYAYSSLASNYMDLGNFYEAIQIIKKALTINPNHSFSWMLLGKAYLVFREYKLSAEALEKSFLNDASNLTAVSNYLYSLNYDDKLSELEIYKEHQRLSELFTKKIDIDKNNSINFPNKREQKIKIAYVSGDFNNHSVFNFFKPLISNYNHEKFTIYCLSNNSYSDNCTEYLKQNIIFVEIFSMTDKEIAEFIIKENIDILIDLSGHTANNRLSIFTQNLCPIQISWMGYPNYTGFNAINYRIVDKFTDPEYISFGEKDIKLNSFFMCYAAPKDYLIEEPPCVENNFITFGSLNNIYKINNSVIEAWSQILIEDENNKFLMKYHGFNDPYVIENIKKEFLKCGINSNQLIFLGKVSNEKHFLTYNKIDIALDTFPYNGTTTTCESLWMSTPLISFEGDCHRSRVSHSILNNLGLPELSAKSKKDYISLIKELSKDKQRIIYYKKTIRDKMIKSSLMDGKNFTKEIEKTFTNLLSTSQK